MNGPAASSKSAKPCKLCSRQRMPIQALLSKPFNCKNSGFSYMEVMLAASILAVALVPIMRSAADLQNQAAAKQQDIESFWALQALSETVQAESFDDLISVAAVANGASTPTSYSDAAGSPQRRLIYIYAYDWNNSDADDDPLTIADPNLDADNNPFTGSSPDIELLWYRAQIENSTISWQGLIAP